LTEQRVIEHALLTLETGAQRLEQGQAIRPVFFPDAADFVKALADGCHHHKEDGALFKAIVAAGVPSQADMTNRPIRDVLASTYVSGTPALSIDGLFGIHNPPPDMADVPPKRGALSTIDGSRPASFSARAAVKAADPEPMTTTC
jgi:hypothetical protein